jgi:hypothetical protein
MGTTRIGPLRAGEADGVALDDVMMPMHTSPAIHVLPPVHVMGHDHESADARRGPIAAISSVCPPMNKDAASEVPVTAHLGGTQPVIAQVSGRWASID